jgi:hypothetical protein
LRGKSSYSMLNVLQRCPKHSDSHSTRSTHSR